MLFSSSGYALLELQLFKHCLVEYSMYPGHPVGVVEFVVFVLLFVELLSIGFSSYFFVRQLLFCAR
jgi:hypothetical protein